MPEQLTIIPVETDVAPERATHFFQTLDPSKRGNRNKWQTTSHLYVVPGTSGEDVAKRCVEAKLCSPREIVRQKVRIVKAYENPAPHYSADDEVN